MKCENHNLKYAIFAHRGWWILRVTNSVGNHDCIIVHAVPTEAQCSTHTYILHAHA